MARILTIRNLYDKVFSYLPLSGDWLQTIGDKTEDNGIWLIYGKEKNGKTTFALKLADYLSTMRKVLYISAEEGASTNLQQTCLRLGISDMNRNLHLLEYISLAELREKLSKRKSARIIFMDNLTEYKYEIKSSDLLMLQKEFPDKLFVFLAHESEKIKGEPDIAIARLCKKKAKRIFHVSGMSAWVLGRTETAVIPIDREKAALCHGDSVNKNKEKEHVDQQKRFSL